MVLRAAAKLLFSVLRRNFIKQLLHTSSLSLLTQSNIIGDEDHLIT